MQYRFVADFSTDTLFEPDIITIFLKDGENIHPFLSLKFEGTDDIFTTKCTLTSMIQEFEYEQSGLTFEDMFSEVIDVIYYIDDPSELLDEIINRMDELANPRDLDDNLIIEEE